MDLLFSISKRKPSSDSVSILSGTCVLGADGDVFRCIVAHVEMLFTDGIVCLTEPVDIKGTSSEFFCRDRSVLCKKRLLFIREILVHVRYEVIACRIKAFPAQVFAYDMDPGVCIKSCFNKTLIGYIRALDQGAESLGILIIARYTNGKKVA